ncbi:MAG: hypothetical protein LM580_10285 [Thermofilum sp.]|nr:hypothetical protein [Thermofilum sp.]
MRPENVVEGKTPTVGSSPTGSAAGLGVTPADAANVRVAAGFLMMQPEVSCEVTIPDLPLPLQIIARAAMFFAEKAADGADVTMVWDERCEDPYLEIRGGRGKLHIGWNRENGVLSMVFTKAREGYYFIKRCDAKVDRTDAENIVRLVAEMLIDAVENSRVRVPAQLERFFKTGEWW